MHTPAARVSIRWLAVLLGLIFSGAASALELWSSVRFADALPLALDFKRLTGRDLIIQHVGADGMVQRLLYGRTIGRLPDAVILPADQLELDVLELPALPPQLLAEDVSEQYNPARTGRMVGLGHSLLIYYNRQLADEPKRWEQLIDSAQGASLATDTSVPFNLMPFLSFAGALDAQGRLANDPLPAILEGLREARRQFASTSVPASCMADNCVSDLFLDGDVPYALAGSWSFPDYQARLGKRLGVTTLPPLNGRPMTPVRFPQYFALAHSGVIGDRQTIEDARVLLDLIIKTPRPDHIERLLGGSPQSDAAELTPALKLVIESSIESTAAGFLNCLLTVLAQEWQAYLVGERSDAQFATALRAQIQGQRCLISEG